MKNLAFLGLGIMGYPIAKNLLEAGHRVALWSNTADKARTLAAEGNGVFCTTPKDAATQSDCIFLCVGDTAMAREVLLGPSGVIEGAKPGTVIADASTISAIESRDIGKAFAAKGLHYLDAPCTGSKAGAESGSLTFMIGGDKDVYDSVRPYLDGMGKRFYYCGGQGMGLDAKLSQNLILSVMMMAFNEGMVLATKAGVSPSLMLDILNNSAARSGLTAAKGPAVLNRDFATNFSTKWMHKDVGLALESAQAKDLPVPLAALTQQLFRAAISNGHGEEDFSSTIQLYEEWSGVQAVGDNRTGT
jgi:3-hydroxyisobutyrate dehydrogenase/2-hydroxy-3-oxopropionate reductase